MKRKMRAKRTKNLGGRPPGRKTQGTLKRAPNFFPRNLLTMTLEDLFGKPKPKKKSKR